MTRDERIALLREVVKSMAFLRENGGRAVEVIGWKPMGQLQAIEALARILLGEAEKT